MREIVVAGSSQKLLGVLDKILCQADIHDFRFCKSGTEVTALANSLPDAVLICGPLKDTASIYLAKTLPDSWDIILLLTSQAPFPYYVSNIIPINLPVNRKELVETITSVAMGSSETYGSKTTAKKQRSQQELALIEQAKAVIMRQRSLTESDAHKLLQRLSMNLGITMEQTAKRFLEDR